MRRLLALGLFLAATPLSAQEGVPWRSSYFPYPIGNPTTGVMLVGHYHHARQADFDARVPFDGIFSAEGGWSTNNSRFVGVTFRAPRLVPGWRFAVDAGAGREGTFGYYGFGPDGSNEDFEPDDVFSDDFFRVRRTRYFVRGEVTRGIAGPLSVSAAAGYTHFRFSSSHEGSLFDSDYLNTPLTGADATARVSLIVDTRDNELLPGNGVLLEMGVYTGSGRFETRSLPPLPQPGEFQATFTESGYLGGYVHLRGYVSPRSGTVIAGRLAVRDMGASAPLDARYTLPGWERDVTVLGGADSHRSFMPGRFVGTGLLLGALEVRHNLLDLGGLGAVTLIAFLDAGRVFSPHDFQWTTKGWKVGGGGGVGVRVLQAAPLLLNFAGGPDGFRFTMGNGWSF